MKNNKGNKEIREGKPSTIPQDNQYPRPSVKDKQVKNQPEYTEEQPNRPSSGTPQNKQE